jgi:hypothetical protein
VRPWLQDGSIHLDEEDVGALVKHLRREARNTPQLVHGMLLDCAVQLSTKVPVYALLVGASCMAAARESLIDRESSASRVAVNQSQPACQ